MNPLAEKIRTRGHWRVVIRPHQFSAQAIPYRELEPIVRESIVAASGWPFPHFDATELIREADSIGMDTDWNHYKEVWRFFRSGQFYFLGGLTEDWRDESGLWQPGPRWQAGKRLPVVTALLDVTEFCEFAARLATHCVALERLSLTIQFNNLANRRLVFDHRNVDPTIFHQAYSGERWEWTRQLDITQLAGSVMDLAVEIVNDLFSRMDWSMDEDRAHDLQRQYLTQLFE